MLIYLFMHRWRMRMKNALTSKNVVAPRVNDAVANVKDNEDDQLLNEMEELTHLLDKKKKKAKKLLSKRRAKVCCLQLSH